jgi:hypothetical protein
MVRQFLERRDPGGRDGLLLEKLPSNAGLVLGLVTLAAFTVGGIARGLAAGVAMMVADFALLLLAVGFGMSRRLPRVLLEPRERLFLGRHDGGGAAYRALASEPLVEIDGVAIENDRVRGVAVRRDPAERNRPDSWAAFVVLERAVVETESFATAAEARAFAERLADALGSAILDGEGDFEATPRSPGYAVAMLLTAILHVWALLTACPRFADRPDEPSRNLAVAAVILIFVNGASLALFRLGTVDALRRRVVESFGVRPRG